MVELRITRGLRALEFIAGERSGEGSARARVEFARASALPAGEPVHISLGIREGKLRALVGVPQLMEEPTPGSPCSEYLYSLSGQITEEAP